MVAVTHGRTGFATVLDNDIIQENKISASSEESITPHKERLFGMVKTYAEGAGEQAYSCLSGEGTLLITLTYQEASKLRNPSEVTKKEVKFPITILLLFLSSFQECWPCPFLPAWPFC